VAVACERSTFEYMSAHRSQFDESPSRVARNAALGLPPEAGRGNSKVRKGQVSARPHANALDQGLPVVLPFFPK
jgi:hypothetical protein